MPPQDSPTTFQRTVTPAKLDPALVQAHEAYRRGETELARAAWRDRPDLPVLFVSGHAAPEVEGLEGRSLLLRKPCRPDDLQQALRRLVCGHALD